VSRPTPRRTRASRAAAAVFPCARCGRTLRREPRGPGHPAGALKIACPRCRFRIYDYPRVCVGFVVAKRGQVLLLTRGEEPRRGWFDLPGGFLEEGEDLSRAARRELREETRLTVGPAELLGLYWDRYPLPGFGVFPTLSFYFAASWRSGTPRAGDDAAEARWVALDELVAYDVTDGVADMVRRAFALLPDLTR
jgi:8-oxo-dGTP diphosphatase